MVVETFNECLCLNLSTLWLVSRYLHVTELCLDCLVSHGFKSASIYIISELNPLYCTLSFNRKCVLSKKRTIAFYQISPPIIVSFCIQRFSVHHWTVPTSNLYTWIKENSTIQYKLWFYGIFVLKTCHSNVVTPESKVGCGLSWTTFDFQAEMALE